MDSEKQGQSAEIQAMAKVEEVLQGLDEPARGRVLRWAYERFDVKLIAAKRSDARAGASRDDRGEGANDQEYAQLADLYAAAAPTTDAQKALVVGYWAQFVKGQSDLDAQSVNSELKHLGHRVGNITRAFDALKDQRPQLVVQTRKSGDTKQARKKYKLTTEGRRAVEEMLRGRDQRGTTPS